MLISWVINSISRKIALIIIYLDTAEAMLRDLKEMFTQGNDPRAHQLHKTISSLTQGKLDVSSYYTQLKGLWDELDHYTSIPSCSCGALKLLQEIKFCLSFSFFSFFLEWFGR